MWVIAGYDIDISDYIPAKTRLRTDINKQAYAQRHSFSSMLTDGHKQKRGTPNGMMEMRVRSGIRVPSVCRVLSL